MYHHGSYAHMCEVITNQAMYMHNYYYNYYLDTGGYSQKAQPTLIHPHIGI